MKRSRFGSNNQKRRAIIHAAKDKWPEQIIGLLRQAEVGLGQAKGGLSVPSSGRVTFRTLGIAGKPPYHGQLAETADGLKEAGLITEL